MPEPFARRQFPDLAPAAWEHPADAAALRTLRAVPGFDRVVAATMGRLNEWAMGRRVTQGSELASPDSHPRLHQLFEEVKEALDAEIDVPLRVKKMGGINALTVGVDAPIIVLAAEAEELLSDDEIKVVLSHELAHILSGHILYKMMLGLLLQIGWTSLALPFSLPIVLGVVMAMLEWDRKSELSADRASALVLGGAGPVVATLRQAGDERGLFHAKLTEVPEEWRELATRVAGASERLFFRHPPIADRIEALEAWVETEQWAAIQRGDYPKRAELPRPGTLDGLKGGAQRLGDGLVEAWGPLRRALGFRE